MRGARLQVVRGSDKGREFYVRNDMKIEIGRSDRSDLCLSDAEASRRHCVIVSHDGTYIIRDLNSTYGVLVNDYPVSKQTLDEDDRITIAETDIAFNLVDVPEAFFSNKPIEEGGEVAVEVEDQSGVAAKYQILDVKCDDCGRFFHNLRWRPGMTCRACNSPNFAPAVQFDNDVDLRVVGEEQHEREEIKWYRQTVVQLGAAGGLVAAIFVVFLIATLGSGGGGGLEMIYFTADNNRVLYDTTRAASISAKAADGGIAYQGLYCRTSRTVYPNTPPNGQTTIPEGYMRPCPVCGETRTMVNPGDGPVKIVVADRNYTRLEGVTIWSGPGSVQD